MDSLPIGLGDTIFLQLAHVQVGIHTYIHTYILHMYVHTCTHYYKREFQSCNVLLFIMPTAKQVPEAYLHYLVYYYTYVRTYIH